MLQDTSLTPQAESLPSGSGRGGWLRRCWVENGKKPRQKGERSRERFGGVWHWGPSIAADLLNGLWLKAKGSHALGFSCFFCDFPALAYFLPILAAGVPSFCQVGSESSRLASFIFLTSTFLGEDICKRASPPSRLSGHILFSVLTTAAPLILSTKLFPEEGPV